MKTNGPKRRRLWRTLLALAVAALMIVPYLAARGGPRLALAIDDRHAAPAYALARLTVYPHDGFDSMYPDGVGYEIMQRQVLSHPSGLLYALGWQDEAGQSCLANAFVEAVWDSFGGWKGRGAWGHCSALQYTAWVTGKGEYDGLAVANGLSGAAALVMVSWRTGETTYARPINGVFMSVLHRHAARAARVDFLDSSGALLHSIEPYG